MSFQYLLYLKLNSWEENAFWCSHISIIFEILMSYLEHKGRLQKCYSHIQFSIWCSVYRHWLFGKVENTTEKRTTVCPLVRCWDYSPFWYKDGNKEFHCYLSSELVQDHAFNNLVVDEILEDINHDQKSMKYLEGLFLKRKFDSGNLYTIPKKPRFAFFFRESMVLLSVQLESKKENFELSNEELLIIN